MIRKSHGWIVATGVLLMFGLTAASTQAAPASCTIRSIHGLAAPGGLDKRLRPLHKQLARPPFSSFKTMKLIKASALVIPQNSMKQVTLPTGKILKLTFKEKLLERKDKVRLRMHLSITPPQEDPLFARDALHHRQRGYAPGGGRQVQGRYVGGGRHLPGQVASGSGGEARAPAVLTLHSWRSRDGD